MAIFLKSGLSPKNFFLRRMIFVNKGDIVLVSFTGKDTQANRIFDTTDEKTARDNRIFSENANYGPMPVLLGKGELIAGIEEEIEKMNEGEQKSISIEPKKAFGERRNDLVFVVPLQEFRKKQVNPFPGLVVEINGRYGRVQAVSGGRVRVDFNSDLAGKTVEYSIKVEKTITEPKEKAQVLAQKFFPFKGKKAEVKINGTEIEVTLPKGLPQGAEVLKDAYAKTVTENVKGIEKVKFVEEFEKEKEKSEKE